MKTSKLLILLLIIVAFGAGIYFKDDAIRLYNNLNNQIKNFQGTDIGSVVSEIGKQVLAPAPLRVGGEENKVVLLKSKVIEETNLQRQQNGLSALKENAKLDLAASTKANDMFLNQYFEHESPSGIDPGKLVSSYRYDYIIAGENLILGNFSSEKEVLEKWMASPGHRENILNSRYVEIGVAIIKGTYKDETVWIGVQEFALPLSVCPQPDSVLKNQIDSEKMQLDILLGAIDEKRDQIKKINPGSASYSQMVDDYNQTVAQYNSLAEEIKSKIIAYNSQVNIFNNCVAGK